MQKILLFVFAVLFAIPSYAQRERSLLKIRDENGRMITAEINGRRYEEVSKILTFKDLPARNHNIKVYVVNRDRYGRRARLIYEGRLRTRPGRIYYVTIDDYEGLDIITDCCLGDNGPWTKGNSWYRSRYYDKQSWEKNLQFDPQKEEYYEDLSADDRMAGRRPKDEWSYYGNVMTVARYNRLIESMRNASFESERMSIAKMAIDENPVSAKQLTGILKEFSFESSRLRMAKFGYKQVVNPRSAFEINDAFEFASSRREFEKFVSRQKRD